MKYLSVCSGIEAATVAWHNLGWTPVGFSEIEPFPSAVLAHHYPNVPNFGDMTKHDQWPLQPGSIDLLVGGTPCQSFSVAGLRKGLHDPRGGLMLTYLEIARRLRPRWVVWENVPGVLSSNGGRDFGSFLGAMGLLGYGVAYRVLDAQWCRTHGHPRAVPQRRRRVFVVGCLGDWERAAQVLFERESVQRDSAPRRTARQGAAYDAENGIGAGGWMPNNPGVVSSVCTKWSKGTGGPSGSEHFNLVTEPITVRSGSIGGFVQDDVGGTMRAKGGDYHGGSESLVMWPADVAATLDRSSKNSGSPGGSNQEIFSQHGANLVPQPIPVDDASPTLTSRMQGSSGWAPYNETAHLVPVMQQAVPIQDGREMQKAQNGIGIGDQGDPAYTLDTTGAQAVGQPIPFTKSKRAQSVTDDKTWVDGKVNPTLSLFDQGDTRATTVAVAFSDTSSTLKGGSGERGYPDPSDGNGHSMVGTAMTVRRLTPRVPPAVAFASNLGTRGGDVYENGVSPTVRTGSSGTSGHPPAVAHALRGEGFDASEDGTGRGTPLVPVETLQQQGYNGDHASTQEANAIATLRVLRDEIGEEAFAAWGFGILDSLQPSQVLRSCLHGKGIRCAAFSRSWPIDCAISRPEDRAAWAVRSVREAEGEGCPPSGRQLPQQLAEQLGAYLSQLPCPGPQAEKLMHHLWCAGEGIGILRQALSAIQEARRSPDVPGTTPANTMTVRRLTATECEFLQGFPRNYTLIPWRKKAAADCPDGPRYKALGNSMAVNCMAWIGERIAAVDAQMNERNET